MTGARTIGRRLRHAALAAALLGAAPAQADDPLGQAEQGLREILSALELLMSRIPQYEMPEVLDNGDIVIRRIRPETPADPDDDGIVETAI